jgi:hypothetical protein
MYIDLNLLEQSRYFTGLSTELRAMIANPAFPPILTRHTKIISHVCYCSMEEKDSQ